MNFIGFFIIKAATHYQIIFPKSINELKSNGMVIFVIVQHYPLINSLCKYVSVDMLALHVDNEIQGKQKTSYSVFKYSSGIFCELWVVSAFHDTTNRCLENHHVIEIGILKCAL